MIEPTRCSLSSFSFSLVFFSPSLSSLLGFRVLDAVYGVLDLFSCVFGEAIWFSHSQRVSVSGKCSSSRWRFLSLNIWSTFVQFQSLLLFFFFFSLFFPSFLFTSFVFYGPLSLSLAAFCLFRC